MLRLWRLIQFALGQERFGIALQFWQVVLNHIPDKCVTHHAVTVNESISECDNLLEVSDARRNLRKVARRLTQRPIISNFRSTAAFNIGLSEYSWAVMPLTNFWIRFAASIASHKKTRRSRGIKCLLLRRYRAQHVRIVYGTVFDKVDRSPEELFQLVQKSEVRP